jgi:hypothetical protein
VLKRAFFLSSYVELTSKYSPQLSVAICIYINISFILFATDLDVAAWEKGGA